MTEAKHTPTPWTITFEDDKDHDYTILGGNGAYIANDTCYYPSAPCADDAVFIVKAVNCYADTVEALVYARDCMSRAADIMENDSRIVDAAYLRRAADLCRAAIAKAVQP